MAKFLLILLLASPLALAGPLAAPGDMRLRSDLQLLNDTGVIDIPLTAWPIALGDAYDALQTANRFELSGATLAAFDRVRDHLSWELGSGARFQLGLSGSENPRVVRTFEQTPREEGQATARLDWLGERFTINLSATVAANPLDGEEFRPDGTYLGMALGNWVVTAGWQERWWGPSRDGSLILGTTARPSPGIALQRNNSMPFETKWLSWLGPWSLTTFMNVLDDQRTIEDALLFGIRGSFRPPKTGLEIGISRTAQWCGKDRPCSASVFWDLLLGRDNRGVNVDPDQEPGNQLGGFDIRWVLPKQVPAALYMQWIGEDGRGGGNAIGAWMRQVGVEAWGNIGDFSHRSHFEVSDVQCREGGFGFSDPVPNCAYEHSIYTTGYRYRNRAIGHGADGDSLSYSLGSTLVQSAGHTWNISLRYMEINRDGAPNPRHTLSPTPQELTDVQISHERETRYGRFYAGIGYGRLEDATSGASNSDVSAFLQWSSR